MTRRWVGGVDADGRFLGRANIDGIPLRVELRGETRGLAQQPSGIRALTADRDHDLAERADIRLAPGRVALLAIEKVRGFGQRHLAQAREILLGEEIRQRRFDPFLGINFSGLQPLLQILGGQIDVHDLVGFGQDFVGHALLHAHAGCIPRRNYRAIRGAGC